MDSSKCDFGFQSKYRGGIKLVYLHGMEAATVQETGQIQIIQAFTNCIEKNQYDSYISPLTWWNKVVGDTSLRGQNCVIRFIMTGGSVSCTNAGTILNI